MEYRINTELYKTALDELEQDFRARNPIHPSISQTVVRKLERHAKIVFGTTWHTAVKMVEDNETHTKEYGQLRLEPMDPRRLAGLTLQDQKQFAQIHSEMSDDFQKDNADRAREYATFYRTLLVNMFTRVGVTQTTAEKVVGNYLLKTT